MSEKMSFEPPRGMCDFYPEDMQLHNKIFDAFKKSAAMSGF